MHTKLPDADKTLDVKPLILFPMTVQISARKLGSCSISHDAEFSCSLSIFQRTEKLLTSSFNVYCKHKVHHESLTYALRRIKSYYQKDLEFQLRIDN